MRIASLSPAATEILFAIGAGKDIVCVDRYSDFPSEAAAIPHLSDHQKIDIDELASYQPEIVFTGTLVQQKLAAELRAADKFAVIHHDPRSLGDIASDIRSIGMLLEREREANELVAKMQQGFSDLRRKAKLLPKKPKLYIEEWHHPPMVSGNWVPEAIETAGGVSVKIEKVDSGEWAVGSGSRNGPSRGVTLEEIQAFNPDIIVLSICGAGKLAEKRLLTERAGWAELEAAKNDRVFVIDDSLLNRPGPRLVEGAQRLYGWMFQILH